MVASSLKQGIQQFGFLTIYAEEKLKEAATIKDYLIVRFPKLFAEGELFPRGLSGNSG